ncbi:hypothetical protein LJC56_01070 [Christensenellaceae bacterium OttesenSCG-928-K19]|nr:hypothetical protein [Christensenellaceae bacterium OttesenSCG-928-K19]
MNQKTPSVTRVNCGELCKTTDCTAAEINLLHAEIGDLLPNISIGYERFIKNPDELPNRILDLLQIAAYVFCGDRMANRGSRDSVDNNSWARSLEFRIPVLDIDFWENEKTKKALICSLSFMTGDRNFSFVFTATNKNPAEAKIKQISLFSKEYSDLDEAEKTDVVLFSGGLDSLAGIVQRLNEHPDRLICAVSHKSSKSVTHTQESIISKLNEKYDNKIKKYGFECCNHGGLKSKDETQRTRMFLFSAIAFSLCNCYDKHEFYVYENGITSLNLSKQADVINARASRTTHPKTLGLLRQFYRLLDPAFNIVAPYYNKTKAEVLEVFKIYNERNIISSSVSCSSSRKKRGQVPHCGCCSQCIDRRFSVYASGLEDYDALYATDFINAFPDDDKNETKQRLYITLRLANLEDISTQEEFLSKYPTDITDMIEYWQNSNNADDKFDEIYDLVCRYGKSVIDAATIMRNKYDDLTQTINKDSLLGIISERKYKDTPCFNRVNAIDGILKKAIPDIFQKEKPKNERDFNDKLHGILNVQASFTREYPTLLFGLSSYIADQAQGNLIIESKYIRGKTTPSVADKGIAEDIVKIPDSFGVMFVVYDPYGSIINPDEFAKAFETKRKDCYVRIYR